MDSTSVDPNLNTRSTYISLKLSSLVPLVSEIRDLTEKLSVLQEQMQVPEQERCSTKEIAAITTDIELLFLRSCQNAMRERREVINKNFIDSESPHPALNEDSKITEKGKELLHFPEQKSSEQDHMATFGNDESDKPNKSVQIEESETESAYIPWDESAMETLLTCRHELRRQIVALALNKILEDGPNPAAGGSGASQSTESLEQAVSAIDLDEK